MFYYFIHKLQSISFQVPLGALNKRSLFNYEYFQPRLKVTRGMLVLGVYGNEAGKLDLGDWVFALNSKIITNKKHYYKIIKEQLRLNIPYTVSFLQ